MILALGESPAEVGFDLVRLLNSMRDWSPKQLEDRPRPELPSEIVTSGLHLQAVRAITRTSMRDVIREIAINSPGELSGPQAATALSAYLGLRKRAEYSLPAGPPPGYRAGFVKLIDPHVRAQVARIYEEAYEPAPEESYGKILERCDALTAWILEPLNMRGPQ
jgi:hypothetical protein